MHHGNFGIRKGARMNFYKGKKVLVTGHTGFKGTWMCKVLNILGAQVTGYSLAPMQQQKLFSISGVEKEIDSRIGDIRQLDSLMNVFHQVQPEIVFHMAAQPLVLEGYENPVYTFDTNVMGTVNVLECIRTNNCVKSFVNITTDKVYQNKEWDWGYRENEVLKGKDPYSSSKSCSELVTYCYQNSFFQDCEISISTARAGNVIGGGDFADNRIIPDCIRAALSQKAIMIRNPYSIRPFQHVLEPIMAYLLLAKCQYHSPLLGGSYNVGPSEEDCITVEQLVRIFIEHWGEGITYQCSDKKNEEKEAKFLKLDCSKIRNLLGWQPTWNIQEAVAETVLWQKAYVSGQDMMEFMDKQIKKFMIQWEGNRSRNEKME